MRGLLRSILALGTLGLAVIGCNRSGSADPPAEPADLAPVEAPYQAAFRVPGMT
jgi:hypothetical protein